MIQHKQVIAIAQTHQDQDKSLDTWKPMICKTNQKFDALREIHYDYVAHLETTWRQSVNESKTKSVNKSYAALEFRFRMSMLIYCVHVQFKSVLFLAWK